MLTVDDYAKIRLAHRDGMSIREIARTFHHSRRKVRADPRPARSPSPTRAPSRRPLRSWAPFTPSSTPSSPPTRTLRPSNATPPCRSSAACATSTATRGGYDQVRRYVGRHRRDRRETFIPLAHDPGQRLEADFGHIHVDFPDGRRLVPVLIAAWAYSNYGFALALPTERTEAILAGMVEAFTFFGCVPREVWWDNPTTVVAPDLQRPRASAQRRTTRPWPATTRFEPLFCMPARGNEKPHAETRVRVLQRQWATPVPRVADLAALNAHLRQRCLAEAEPHGGRLRRSRSASASSRDRAAALPLPAHPLRRLHRAGGPGGQVPDGAVRPQPLQRAAGLRLSER